MLNKQDESVHKTAWIIVFLLDLTDASVLQYINVNVNRSVKSWTTTSFKKRTTSMMGYM